MIFFKKKKIIVDCFTPFETVFNFYKIDRASRFFPKEISAIDREIEITDKKTNILHKASTLKNCDALRSIFRSGIIIPFWTDLICRPGSFLRKETRRFKFRSNSLNKFLDSKMMPISEIPIPN